MTAHVRIGGALSTSRQALFQRTLELVGKKCLEDEAVVGIEFPHVTENGGGAWRTLSASFSAGYRPDGSWTHGNWNCGFWVGMLVAAALATKDEKFLQLARDRMLLVAPRSADPNTHDIGFIFMGSALPLYQATGDRQYAEIALAAAKLLRARTVVTPTGSYIASWGPLSDPRGRVASAIDTMTNLPLLYWASDYSGDESFKLAGEAHARKTRSAFFRNDFSTYHAVEYDLATGARKRGYTFQGHNDESAWSRGQTWAVYGFASTAAATGMREHLDTAERAADYYLSRLGSNVVPPYDFDDPNGKDIPDSAAAAIIASAFIEMGLIHPDRARAAHWMEQGVAMLEQLCTHTVAWDDKRRGILQHGCYSKPHNEGVDSAVMFGDFFFVEALCKLLFPGRYRSELKAMMT